MSLLWTVPFAVAGGLVLWLYRRREASVEGRGALAALRVAALAVLALLLVNPGLPGGLAGPPPAAWILLDASLSMDAAGGAAWQEAGERVRALEDSLGDGRDVRLLLFGDGSETLPSDSVAGMTPDGPRTLLAPALARAAEAGASEIRVVSDLRVADPVSVEAALAEIPAPVRLEGVGRAVRNAAVAELALPAGVAGGERPTATVRVQGEGGGPGDSVTVEIREDERLVASRRIALPGRGREAPVTVRLPAPGARGEVAYTARAILEGDAFPADDRRTSLLTVDPPEGGALLLSLSPDWEPRFLLPVLRQVTGLELTGWLRVGEDRWIPLAPAGSSAGGGTADGAAVRRLAGRARFLVLHGADGDAPGWVGEAARTAPRVLLFPEGPGGASLLGVETGAPLPGEWEPVAELPPSPLAGELAGLELSGLPPLTGVLPLIQDDGVTVPLRLALRGRGPGEASMALVRDGGRRRAVALASGFWRWAFRQGGAREAYRRFWAAVASWLLAEEGVVAGPGLRPASRVVAAGEPVAWSAPGLQERSVRLEIRRQGEEAPVRDTTLRVPPGGAVRTGPLDAGSYRYRAVTADDGEEVGTGRLEAEAFSDELLHPVLDTGRLGPLGAGSGETVGPAASSRPLRTHPLPYLLVLAFLSAEWIGRRRKGLR